MNKPITRIGIDTIMFTDEGRSIENFNNLSNSSEAMTYNRTKAEKNIKPIGV
jgi:hypothetical protein